MTQMTDFIDAVTAYQKAKEANPDLSEEEVRKLSNNAFVKFQGLMAHHENPYR